MSYISQLSDTITQVRNHDDLWLWVLISATAIAVGVNAAGFLLGNNLIPPALLYIPVIITGYRYPKKAILFSIFLGLIYLTMVYGLSPPDGLTIAAGTAHFYGLVLVGIVTSLLSGDLQARENRYHGLFERSAAGILLVTCDAMRLTIEEANQRGARLFGFTPDEIKNVSLLDLWPDESERAPFLTSIGTGETVREYRASMIRKDGSNVPVIISTGVLKDRRMVFTVSDISTLCEKEAKLALSEARKNAILTALPDLVLVFDRSGIFLDHHTQYPQDLYLPSKAFIGKHYAEVVPGELAKKLTKAFDALYETGNSQKIEYFLPIRGCERIFEARLVPSGNDQCLAVVRDVTTEAQARDALAVSEARYRAIVEDQTEFIVRYLPNGTISFVNRAFSAYMRRSPDEFTGLSLGGIIPAEDREKVFGTISSLTPEVPSTRIEHRMLLPNHEARWTSWTYRGRFSPVGELGEFQAIGRDVSEQIIRDEIEQKSLRQIEQNIEQFAIIGDHIRNPLAVIVGLADLHGGDCRDRIIEQAKVIDEFITRLDMGWVESEKVRGFIRKYGGFGKN